MPLLQQLAAKVAPGFTPSMQELCNDMATFLPAALRTVPGEGSGPAAGGGGPPQDTNEGSPGPDAGSGSGTTALAKASSAWAGSTELTAADEDSDWYAKKRTSSLSSSSGTSGGAAAEVPAQSVWLTFKDANLEELFKLARAAHCHSVCPGIALNPISPRKILNPVSACCPLPLVCPGIALNPISPRRFINPISACRALPLGMSWYYPLTMDRCVQE